MSEEEQQVITKSAMASAAGFSGSGITERSNEDDIAAAEGSECSGYNFYSTNEQSKVINSSSSSSSQSSSTKIHEHDYIGLASCAEKALGEVSPSENASAVATDLNLGLRLGPAPNTNGNSQQEVDQRFKVGTKRGLSGVPKDQLLFSSSSSSAAVDPWRHDWSNSSFAPYQQPSQTQTKNTAVNNKTTNNERRIRTCAIAAETYDAPSPSSAVVGWPPVQSFRKNTLVTPQQIIKTDSSLVVASAAAALASCALHPPLPPLIPPTSSAPSAAVTCLPTSDGGMSSSLFVKVYMDGVPIGRKVDLDANNSYLKLSSALKDMFSAFFNTWQASATKGKQQQQQQQQKQQLSYLDGSDAEYVLTYEDRDGDLMLVGDVPWRMFTCTVRRLRIMKSSDAIGLMPEMVRA